MRIGVLKLEENAVVPEYAMEGDAGLDLVAIEKAYIYTDRATLVRTGIAVAIPAGYVGLIMPRSGLAAKNAVTVLNAPGVIDSGYRGELKVLLITHGQDIFQVEPGDRIAQLIILPYMSVEMHEVHTLNATTRGGQGFGSTGVGVGTEVFQ